MNTLEILDAIKKEIGKDSDYAVAKALKTQTSTIYGYRARGGQMDDAIALRAAEILHVEPEVLLLNINRERSRDPAVQAVWDRMLEKISVGFEVLISRANPHGALFSLR